MRMKRCSTGPSTLSPFRFATSKIEAFLLVCVKALAQIVVDTDAHARGESAIALLMLRYVYTRLCFQAGLGKSRVPSGSGVWVTGLKFGTAGDPGNRLAQRTELTASEAGSADTTLRLSTTTTIL